jgi:flagellar motility protein MotE (MotC chaperone)
VILAVLLAVAEPVAPAAPVPPVAPHVDGVPELPTANTDLTTLAREAVHPEPFASGRNAASAQDGLREASAERSRRAATATATTTSTPTPTSTPTSTSTPHPAPRPPGPAAPGLAKKPLGKTGAKPRLDRTLPTDPLLDLSAPAPAPLADPVVMPPSLGGSALRDELRASAHRRQEELAALAKERERLEKLAAEVNAAQAALRRETARLEELTKQAAADRARAKEAAHAARPPSPEDEKRAVGLARTLKGMKPDHAATLLARVERPLAVSLLRRMRPADAGAVLERMKPEAAAELFSHMASPGPGGTP